MNDICETALDTYIEEKNMHEMAEFYLAQFEVRDGRRRERERIVERSQ